jgi:DNA-binding LytR/AlgR family response regulator
MTSPPLTAVIIDDEEPARKLIKAFLKEFCPGQIEIAGEGECLKTSVSAIRSARPDVVFLDMNLLDSTGLDVLRILDESERDFAPIVITQWPDYAIEAIKENVVAFLTKPLDPDEFMDAIKKAHQYREYSAWQRARKTTAFLEFAETKDTKKPAIQLYYNRDMHEVPLENLVYCHVEGNNTMYLLDSDTENVITMKAPLKKHGGFLLKNGFISTDKSTLVNPNHITQLKHGTNGAKSYAILTRGYKVEMSNDKYNEILKKKKEGKL